MTQSSTIWTSTPQKMRSMNFTKYDSENMWPSLKTQQRPVRSDKNSTSIAKICVFHELEGCIQKIMTLPWQVSLGPERLHPWSLAWNVVMEVRKVIFLSKWATCRFLCVSTISGHCSCLNHLTLVLQLGVVLKWLYVGQPATKNMK